MCDPIIMPQSIRPIHQPGVDAVFPGSPAFGLGLWGYLAGSSGKRLFGACTTRACAVEADPEGRPAPILGTGGCRGAAARKRSSRIGGRVVWNPCIGVHWQPE